MATKGSETAAGPVTADWQASPFAPLFVVLTRFVMGGMILFAGLGKLPVVAGEPFDATGFLAGVDDASPVSGLYAWMAETPVVIDTINTVIPAAQIGIGLALVVGAAVRLAAAGGAVMMLSFYLGHWSGDWLGLFDQTLVYAVVFLFIGVLGAGRIAGVDRYLEQLKISGESLATRYPPLRYLLG